MANNPRATGVDGRLVPELPQDVMLVKVKSEWPIHVFTDMTQAVSWYEDKDRAGLNPKVWLAKITFVQELTYQPPSRGTLVVDQ